jgi:hypothetical protein
MLVKTPLTLILAEAPMGLANDQGMVPLPGLNGEPLLIPDSATRRLPQVRIH